MHKVLSRAGFGGHRCLKSSGTSQLSEAGGELRAGWRVGGGDRQELGNQSQLEGITASLKTPTNTKNQLTESFHVPLFCPFPCLWKTGTGAPPMLQPPAWGRR